MRHCPICHGDIEVVRVACPACGVGYDGGFELPRLARLGPEEQQLAERIILAAGNLKEVAAALGISYPTLRKRVDGLIAALAGLRDRDGERTERLLDDVERGETSAERAARLIKEMNGGA